MESVFFVSSQVLDDAAKKLESIDRPMDSDKKKQLQEMIDEADRDGDGEINEDEFLRIMKKTSLY